MKCEGVLGPSVGYGVRSAQFHMAEYKNIPYFATLNVNNIKVSSSLTGFAEVLEDTA